MFKLTIRGSTIDARPFLKALTSTPTNESTQISKSAKAEKKEADSFKGFDIDLKSGILTGFNKEVMTGVDLKLSRRGTQIRQLAVQGRFGHDAIQGSMNGDQTVKISAQDSGALLSFIDLYKHMEGGQLAASMKLSEDPLDGGLEIQNFTLRDEPAIRRLVAQSTEVSAPGENADAARKINAGAVGFKRLKVNFSRAGSRLELRDATMYGPDIGLSVDGWLDYSHDRVAMNGTFVPAFAINNLFSQIPVLGVFPRRQIQRGVAGDHLQDLGVGEFADAQHQPALRHHAGLPAQHLRRAGSAGPGRAVAVARTARSGCRKSPGISCSGGGP